MLRSFCLVLFLAQPALAQPLLKPLRMVESKPITVNGIEFVAIMPPDWIIQEPKSIPPRRPGEPAFRPTLEQIDIQLRLTNRSDQDLIVLLGNAFTLEVKNAAGAVVSNIPPVPSEFPERPVLLPVARSHCLQWPVKIIWLKPNDWFFMDCEHRGRKIHFGKLMEGDYSLSVAFSNLKELPKVDGVPIWLGDVSTPPVRFGIKLPAKKGRDE